MKDGSKFTTKYKEFNHHHTLTDKQEIVNFGTGDFIADKELLPLLKALNSIGLITRTHCSGHDNEHAFVGILMDNDVSIEVRKATEIHSNRDFNSNELIISWKK